MARLKRGRIQAVVVASVLGAFLLLSCQPAQPAATPKPAEKAGAATPAKAVEKPVRGGTLRVSYSADPISLDPHVAPSLTPINDIFDLLIEPDVDGNLTKEGLFKDWTVSSDGKVLTFKLQGGIKFHDGTDLDAAAVKFNIERMKDAATKSPYASNYAAIDSMDMVDNLTIRFNLKAPDPLLLTRMTTQGGMMVSPAAVQKLGQDFGRKPVGSGPFQFVEWVLGDRINLKRFDGYWRPGQPYLDQLAYKIITDQTTAFANLRTGLIDVYVTPPSGLPTEQFPALKADPNLAYYTIVRNNAAGAQMNTKRSPFDNKALRQAVALAVDREGIAGRLGELATPANSIFHIKNWGSDGKAGVYPTRDLAKAKAKLAEAGYPSGGLKVSYLTQPDPNYGKDAEIIKANLADIGIDVQIEVLAAAERTARVQTVGGNYQMSLGGLLNGLTDPGHVWGLMFHSKGSRNYTGPYSNPQVDQLLDKAGSIYDQAERATLYRQAGQLIADDAPIVVLYTLNMVTPMNKKVRNYQLSFAGTNGFRETWLAQ